MIGFMRGDQSPTTWMYNSETRDRPKDRAADELETAAGFRSRELQGFTLFLHEGRGWQMSVRRVGENGWDVKIIPEEDAQRILALLGPVDHPDGPFRVISAEANDFLAAVKAATAARLAAGGARNALTAAIL